MPPRPGPRVCVLRVLPPGAAVVVGEPQLHLADAGRAVVLDLVTEAHVAAPRDLPLGVSAARPPGAGRGRGVADRRDRVGRRQHAACVLGVAGRRVAWRGDRRVRGVGRPRVGVRRYGRRGRLPRIGRRRVVRRGVHRRGVRRRRHWGRGRRRGHDRRRRGRQCGDLVRHHAVIFRLVLHLQPQRDGPGAGAVEARLPGHAGNERRGVPLPRRAVAAAVLQLERAEVRVVLLDLPADEDLVADALGRRNPQGGLERVHQHLHRRLCPVDVERVLIALAVHDHQAQPVDAVHRRHKGERFLVGRGDGLLVPGFPLVA